MPLYDLFYMFKPSVEKRTIIEMMVRMGQRVYQNHGVVLDVKSFGRQYLAYSIKKRDGRHYEAQMTQMTMMVPPNFPEQLHFMNTDDKLLRWLLVKHRGTKWMDAMQGKLPSVRVRDEELFRSR